MIRAVTQTPDWQDRSTAPAQVPRSTGVLPAGLMLGVCLIALVHDFTTVGNHQAESIEAGRGMEQQEDFEKDLGAGLLVRKVGFAGIFGLGLWCWLCRPKDVRVDRNLLTLVMLLALGWAAASICWSQEPSETLRELIRIAGYLVLSLGLASRFKIDQLIAVLAVAAGISVGIAVVLELGSGSFRPWLAEYRLHGSIHANALAQHALLLGLVAVYYFSSGSARQRRLALATLAAAFVIIVLTKGRAALAALFVGGIVYYGLGRSWRRWALPASLATTAAGIVMLAGTLAGAWNDPSWQKAANLGREKGYADVGSLTGRIPLWEIVWGDVSESAWGGCGLAAYWTTDRIRTIQDELEWFPRHAHSIYVQTLADLGIVGVALLLAVAGLAILQARRQFRQTGLEAYRFVGCYLIVGMFHGLVESAYVVPRDLGLFVGPLLCSLVFSHSTIKNLEQSSQGRPSELGLAARAPRWKTRYIPQRM